MDTVYILYFGQVIKFKIEDYKKFIEHLVMFRQIDGIEDKYPPYTIAWYLDEFGIEEIEYTLDGASRTFIDHRNGGDLEILSADEFEQLRNDRIAELSKAQRKKFKQAEVLADDNQPMLKYLGLELSVKIDPKRIIELKLPCNGDLDDDYRDMYNLGYRRDRHTEKMARHIQFWRTYALSMAPDDREVKQQQKLEQRQAVHYGRDGGRPVESDITVELVDTAIKSASGKINLPSSKYTNLNKTNVFKAVAEEVKVLTGASKSTFNNRLEKIGISREYIYENMPENIKSRMK